jgi:hypothetical protein
MPWEDEAAFEWFFAHEGGSLTQAARLHRLAKRRVPERAYWAAVAHLCRGQPALSRELLKFAFTRRPVTAILPPLGYLFRRHDAAERIAECLSEVMRRPRSLAKPARAGG